MAVLTLKPHKLEYEEKIQDGYEDSRGDFHEGKFVWAGSIECDAVPANGKANEMKFEDGTTHHYSYIVYMKNDVRDFSIGEKVRITLYGGIQKVFTVKGFHRYQLQSKLWV